MSTGAQIKLLTRSATAVQRDPKDRNISLASLLDGFPDPAIVISKSYEILAANEAYRRQFNDGERVLGTRCFETSHGFSVPCDQAGESCPIQLTRESGHQARVVHVHHTSAGRKFEEVRTYPLFDEGGQMYAYLEILRPTTVATARSSAQKMVGESLGFRRMLNLALRVAPREASVLLLGESGTGKELLAKAIHAASRRNSKKFVPVDCSGLTETLFESELFGHEKGAFTGAVRRQVGLIETCDGGTLFLDEVGDIPLPLQVKLLRLVETGLFRRVGSSDLRSADFRLICATHRDLARMVEEEMFRKDLFYRISSFPITLPPLRERLGDLPLLIRSFGKRLGCPAKVDPSTLEALSRYSFPGNVRELLNILERACLLSDGSTIRPEHLPEDVIGGSPPAPVPPSAETIVPLAEAERRYLRWAADVFGGSRKELAKLLGVSERTLYRKLG
jgi:transcriptional regulator with PAS, ATPase and Fis domain